MRADEVYKIFCQFIDNDFHELRKKVDRMFLIAISGLISIILTLVGIIAMLIRG